jgi:hypothetical protein
VAALQLLDMPGARDDVQTLQELHSLAEVFTLHAPGVEPLPPDVLALDLTGLPAPPREIVAALSRVLVAVGHVGVLAVTPHKRLSRAIARELAAGGFAGKRALWVHPHEVERVWRRLSLRSLGLTHDVERTLHELGLRTAHDLLQLVPRGLSERLLGEARTALTLLRGDDDPITPFRPPPRIEERCELEYAVTSLEALRFVLHGLCERACARLRVRGERLVEGTLVLLGRDFGEAARSFAFPESVVDAGSLLRALCARLESQGSPGGVEKVALVVTRTTRALPRQPDAFAHDTLAPDAVRALVDELTLEFGTAHVGALHVLPHMELHRMTGLQWPPPPVSTSSAHDLASDGRFLALCPWPVHVVHPALHLPAPRGVVREPLCILDVEGVSGPYVRHFEIWHLPDGRRALVAVEPDVPDEGMLEGWFD